MLTMHLFPRNIKAPITLQSQWLNIIFKTVRLNSSSSSGSSSDSDSDTESFKKNAVDNKDGTRKNENLKSVDYLHALDVKKKQKRLEKELSKVAATLINTEVEEDKDKILSNILNTISYMQKNYQSDKSVTSENKETKMQHRRNDEGEDSSVIKTLQRQLFQTQNTKNQFQEKQNVGEEKEPSVIRTLQNQRREMRRSEQPIKTKAETEEPPSVIRTLQKQRLEMRSNEQQIKTKAETEEPPSVIRTLRNQQREMRRSEQPIKTKAETEEPPSVIRTLQKQRREMRSNEQQIKTKAETEEPPSVIRTLRNDQREMRRSEQPIKTKAETEEPPSVIRTLRNQQREVRSSEQYSRAKPVTREGLSALRSLRNQKQSSEDKVEQKPEWFEKIFVNQFTETPTLPELKTWDKCEEHNLQCLIVRYPKNAFEEMIKWTEKGILWHFPINNEQGFEDEKDVHFSEHVFLDRHLAGWCPTKGPVRHFMELVCTGLSKNPYMTVKEKTDHIMWYKNYFNDKQDLLQKLGLAE